MIIHTPRELALSVVIPSLNEAENLEHLLPSLQTELEKLGIGWEILVVESAAVEMTEKAVAPIHNARCIFETQRGYGLALMRGVAESKGEFILTLDADLSHPAEFVPRIWDARFLADIVIASRYIPGAKAEQPLLRVVLSRTLNMVFRNVFNMGVRDMSSGYRLYRAKIFDSLKPEHDNFVILVELLLKARNKGFQICEVPFHYKARGAGQSNARIIAFGLDYLRLLAKAWQWGRK